jgi:hypothetical protein
MTLAVGKVIKHSISTKTQVPKHLAHTLLATQKGHDKKYSVHAHVAQRVKNGAQNWATQSHEKDQELACFKLLDLCCSTFISSLNFSLHKIKPSLELLQLTLYLFCTRFCHNFVPLHPCQLLFPAMMRIAHHLLMLQLL